MSKTDIKISLRDLVTDPFFSEIVIHNYPGGNTEEIRGTWREPTSGGPDEDFSSRLPSFIVSSGDLGNLDQKDSRFQRTYEELIEDYNFNDALAWTISEGTFSSFEIVESFGTYTNALKAQSVVTGNNYILSPLFEGRVSEFYRVRMNFTFVNNGGSAPLLTLDLLYGEDDLAETPIPLDLPNVLGVDTGV